MAPTIELAILAAFSLSDSKHKQHASIEKISENKEAKGAKVSEG